MSQKGRLEQIRRLAGWAVEGDELDRRLDGIEELVKELRAENKAPKKKRASKTTRNREETGGEDRSEG